MSDRGQFNIMQLDDESVQFNDILVIESGNDWDSLMMLQLLGPRQFILMPEEEQVERSDNGWNQMFWTRDKKFLHQ